MYRLILKSFLFTTKIKLSKIHKLKWRLLQLMKRKALEMGNFDTLSMIYLRTLKILSYDLMISILIKFLVYFQEIKKHDFCR